MIRRPRAIAANHLITPKAVIARPLLLLQDGLIERVASQLTERAPEGTLHLPQYTISSGMLDLHVHGAGGHDLMETEAGVMQTIASVLARRGTTEFLATTVTAPVDATLRALEALADAIEAEPAEMSARPVGIHLEGPFLSHAKRGVHPADLLLPPAIDLFERMWQAARGHVRMLTIAPELPGAADLIAHAAGRQVRVSLGHSNATATEAHAGVAAGAVSFTHTYNAMRPLDHREPGILGVALTDDACFADLICDGIHVAPEMVRLWWRAKGAQRAVLISDGTAATGMPDGRYRLGELDVDVSEGACRRDGVLAGSVLTLDRAVANLQIFTGVSLPEAIRSATANPASLLEGRQAADPVRAGAPANLCIWSKAGKLVATVARGALLS